MIFPWTQAVWVGRKGDALRHANDDQTFLCIDIGKIINRALFILKVSS